MQKDEIDGIDKCVVKAEGRSDDNIPACSTVLSQDQVT